jgi:three-Cys-motif partner protein
MNAAPFDWRGWENGELPVLEPHSKFKLEVLRQYVESYIEILFANIFGVHTAEINIVDGFCGGGIYQDNLEGSPLILIRAIKVAEAKINLSRKTRFQIIPKFYFIDEKKDALNSLRYQLKEKGYGSDIGKNIHLINGCFSEKYKDVIQATTKANGRSNRTIFFLDQCGYTKVDLRLIPHISKAARYKAEFIINLAITWMIDFMRDDKTFRDLYEKLGVGEFLDLDQLLQIKEKKEGNWHYAIESRIGPAIRQATQSPFYSPFYIRPAESRRGYWLLHLAPHERARTAMMDVLWTKGNGALHYGGRGLKMHEFRPEKGSSLYFEGFSLHEMNKKICSQDLAEDIGNYLHEKCIDKIPFSELVKQVCNDTVANPEIIKSSLLLLQEASELKLTGKSNGKKRSNTILPTDVIIRYPQKTFSFFSKSF